MYSKSPRARHQATAGPKGIKQGAAGGHPVIPSLSNACLAVSQCVRSLPKCLRGGVLHKEVRPPPLYTIHYALSTIHYPCTMHYAQGAQGRGGQTYTQLDMPTWPTRHVNITIIIKEVRPPPPPFNPPTPVGKIQEATHSPLYSASLRNTMKLQI